MSEEPLYLPTLHPHPPSQGTRRHGSSRAYPLKTFDLRVQGFGFTTGLAPRLGTALACEPMDGSEVALPPATPSELYLSVSE